MWPVEAMEEAGLDVKRTKPVLSYLASPGGTSERLSILVAKWTLRPQRESMVWLMKTKIFVFMW
jgi:8-oxo-dGTP pyrophosphatase MutT (NUDIX family)